MNKVTCEVWILVNSEGEYIAHDDEAALVEEYEERIGEVAVAEGLRRVKVLVTVPLPTPIVATAEITDDEGAEAVAQ